MRNFTHRALAAEKRIYFVMAVCAACIFSSCSVGTYMPNSLNMLGTSTSVVLNQANFRVVRNVEVVVEINNTNLQRADLERSAFAELMRLYPLTGSQAYTNVVMAEVRRESMGPFRALIGLPKRAQHVALRATIIEFLQSNGEPIASVQSPNYAPQPNQYQPQYQPQPNQYQLQYQPNQYQPQYQPQPNQYQPQPEEETTMLSEKEIRKMANKTKNYCYMALLVKTKRIDQDKMEEIKDYFDLSRIKAISLENTTSVLENASKGHDKIFEQFAIQ